MRFSKAFVPTLKEAPKDAVTPSHVLLLRAGFARMVGAGLYEMLPLGLRVQNNISNIVREEMDATGAQEFRMPALLPADYFKESGRWESFGPTLFRMKDRKDGDYHLGPTHEEIITDLARREISSHKQLPLNLYQIQTKFRDEPRPRAGLLRCREFLMKDAYSFDVSEDAARESYATMRAAYQRIFERLGLDYRIVRADSGAMGGSTSAEFQVLAQTGEDRIVACTQCDFAINLEADETLSEGKPCPECKTPLEQYLGIEGGHIFILGTHYSEKMGAHFAGTDGKQQPLVMGCYGIGISRLVAAAIEQQHDDQGMCWPPSIAPYQVVLCPIGKDETVTAKAEELYTQLREHNIEVLLDDRDTRPGAKFKDADLIGIPHRIVIGAKSLANNQVEYKPRTASEATLVSTSDAVTAVLK